MRALPDPQIWFRSVAHVSTEAIESLFDETYLSDNHLLTGTASAGRGNAYFLQWQQHELVLRHYRRGGLVQKISSDRYVFVTPSRTRAFREFDVLTRLIQLQLPVPAPFACRVERHGLLYSASLLTYRLHGNTLAERCADSAPRASVWKNIGKCIARFHQAGLWHADLNAHNILLDEADNISLIDFDRARFRRLPANPVVAGWCSENLDRLNRSLSKLVDQGCIQHAGAANFMLVESAWADAMLTKQ